jgi:hypothetical protein
MGLDSEVPAAVLRILQRRASPTQALAGHRIGAAAPAIHPAGSVGIHDSLPRHLRINTLTVAPSAVEGNSFVAADIARYRRSGDTDNTTVGCSVGARMFPTLRGFPAGRLDWRLNRPRGGGSRSVGTGWTSANTNGLTA